MAELFVGPVIQKLIDTVTEYLKDHQFRWPAAMKEELKRLSEKLPQIQAILDYASGQYQMNDNNTALNKWIWRLRDVVDEADDLLDEIEYRDHEEGLIRNKEKTKKRKVMGSLIEGASKTAKTVKGLILKTNPILKRLEEVVHKLDEVSADVTTFLHLAKEEKQDHQEQQLELYRARETGSYPTDDLIGRGKEKETVMNWLRKTSNEDQTTTFYSNISLLSVVGQGGMGKTTLLQHAYNDELTREFDLKMWVCVSNNFDVKRVIADMLESVKTKRPRLESLNALQKTLKSTVNSQKFLLVLDDIWEEEGKELNKSKWEKVLAPLASGKLGSKILLTTRMASVALMLLEIINKKNEMLILKGLKDDECFLLLNRYAFANVENLNFHQNLRPIAEKMVKKLYGSPLAARVIGGVLNSCLDERHWMRVLNHDIGSQNDILIVLKLSYIFLPNVLRNCLAFCCTFPQDYKFYKDNLVSMWISLGFIQPPNIRGETMKDIGERYFDILVRKSLLDKFGDIHQTTYNLHDVIHEMLRAIFAQQYFSIVGDEELLLRNSETIRYLFVKTSNSVVLKMVEKFKNLRSLILECYKRFDDLVVVLANIFKSLKSIRLIYIYCRDLKQIPEEIGHLIHLRYLNIYGNVTQLPVSLSNLYHLKFMISSIPFGVTGLLPRDLNNLHNLLYLQLFFPGMHEIGKLNSLQELHGFYVQNKNGYRLEELEHMNELRVLSINFHENLNDAKDAYSAKLQDKRNLIDLSLRWSYNSINAVDGLNENVLDNLQPHSSLRKLDISFYKGVRSAIWMNNVDLISSLEHIELRACYNLQTLPPFWQLPFLKYLHLIGMPEVKGFDYEFHENDNVRIFPSLLVLNIMDLQALENWFVATTAATYECLFPCLIELSLHNCPNLLELPSLPPKLKKLDILNIGWKGSSWLQGISNYCSISIYNCPNLISLKGHQEMETTEKCQLILSELIINDPSMLPMVLLTSVTSIQKLGTYYNNKVISFPIEVEQWFLQVSSSLCVLNFKSLKSLQSLPSSLEGLSSLKFLHVEDVPMLQRLPNMPASLQELALVKLESLQSYPSSMESLSSLKILHMEDIPLLQLLPNMPSSLEQLELLKLESLQSYPSSFESLPSLKILHMEDIPLLQLLPNMPSSLEQLKLKSFKYLQSFLSSLESLSSLKILHVEEVPLLQLPSNMLASMKELVFVELKSLQSLPSSLESLSSLKILQVKDVPLLQLLPNMPASLKKIMLKGLKSLQSLPSSLENLSSLKILHVEDVPLLQLLPNMPASMEELKLVKLESLLSQPSYLEGLTLLKILHMEDVPLLQFLPNLPASMEELKLVKLESMRSLPSSLESLSSLNMLYVKDVPQLQLLPNMPASLKSLTLDSLKSLQGLPSSLSFTSLIFLALISIPLLQKLPDLPLSLIALHVKNCHPELKELYQRNWQKIAHIPTVTIY